MRGRWSVRTRVPSALALEPLQHCISEMPGFRLAKVERAIFRWIRDTSKRGLAEVKWRGRAYPRITRQFEARCLARCVH